MTKSSLIREILRVKPKMGNAMVAIMARCSADYVRAVRQRTDANGNVKRSKAELSYEYGPEVLAKRRAATRKHNKWRWHNDPRYRAYQLKARRLKYWRDKAKRLGARP